MTIVKTRRFRRFLSLQRPTARLVGRIGHAAAELVFPRRCILCGGSPGSDASRLCPRCTTTTDRERRIDTCPACASTVAPYEVSEGRCQLCRKRPQRVTGTIRVAPYRTRSNAKTGDPFGLSGVGSLLRLYKFKEREELGPLLGRWLAEAVRAAPWQERVKAIAPVPTHWRRRLARPLHAADALARFVARKTRLPVETVLKRTRCGPHQIGLSYTERAENVRGAFAVGRGKDVEGARLLVVDDVKTTGATLNEVAKVLYRAGAAEVYAAVVVTVAWDRPTGSAWTSI